MNPKTLLAAALALAAFAPTRTLRADNRLSADAETALKAQKDHFAVIAKRGKQVFYTEKFDLGGLPHYRPARLYTGWIRFYGDNYLADGRLGEYWRKGFAKFQPGIRISYYLPTAAAAFPALYYDLADVIMDHEPTFYDLLAYERIKGTDPLQVSACTGSFNVPGWSNSFAIIVNSGNPLTRITVDQLDGVFGAARDGGWTGTTWHPERARGPGKNIRTWGQLGLTGDWADKPIVPYGFAMRYNTSTTFSDKVLEGGDKWNGAIHTYANYMRPDGTRSVEQYQIMNTVAHDKYGIAYVLFHGDGDQPGLKRLAVAPRGTTAYVPHTLETVQNRTYPLYNELWLYANNRPGTPLDPKVKEFLLYVLSQEGQEAVERDGKYLPLTAEVVRENLKKLE